MNNGGMIKTNLIYHGTCKKTGAYKLSLEPIQDRNEKPYLNVSVMSF
jgi:hypothetical protein